MIFHFTCNHCGAALKLATSQVTPELTCSRCGTVNHPPIQHFEPDTLLAGYRIIHRIEAHGGSETFLAERIKDHTPITLQTFTSDSFQQGIAAEYYLGAMKQWMQVRQTNIVKVIEAGRSRAGIFFAASARTQGVTLENRLWQGGAVEFQAAIGLAISISRILGWLWKEHGLIYGQLTPRNIILTPDKNILLSHMALAPILKTRPPGIPLREFAASTNGFTCPEQFNAPDAMDFRGDMYSLGASLYHMLTGKPPFDCLNAEEIFAQHQNPSLADPRLHRPDLPEEFVWLLEILLAHDPKDRFDDWDYLINILASLDCGKPTSQPKPLKSHSVMIRLPQSDIAKLTRHTKPKPLQTLYTPLPTKPRKDYFGIILSLAIVITAVLIIILVLMAPGEGSTRISHPALAPTAQEKGRFFSATKPSLKSPPNDSGTKLFMVLLTETRKFSRDNPDNFEAIIKRYEALLAMAETNAPRWIPELQCQVRDIGLAMSAPLEKEEQAILLRVKQYEERGQYQEGIDWLEQYHGPFPEGTKRLRRSLLNILQSQINK